MKKTLTLLLIVSCVMGVSAQNPTIELDMDRFQIIGPSNTRYMMQMPQISDFDVFEDYTIELLQGPTSRPMDLVSECLFTGLRFETTTPRTIYGVAASLYYSYHVDEDGQGHWAYYSSTSNGKLEMTEVVGGPQTLSIFQLLDTQFVAMVVQKEANGYVRMDSAAYRQCDTKRFFDIGLIGTSSPHFYLGMVEIYFENPVEVHDTFYVGMVPKQHRVSTSNKLPIGSITKSTGATGQIVFPEVPPRWLSIDKYGTIIRTPYMLTPRYGNSVLPVLFPIVAPMEADSVDHSSVQGLTVGRSRYGFPRLEWEDDYLQTGFEIEVTEMDSSFDSAIRITTGRSPYVLRMVNDSTIYYKARVRAMYHPCCEAYNHTEQIGPWSDSVVFYTGVLPPGTATGDTDSVGIPCLANASTLFTLTPNPARGEVTVRVAEPLTGVLTVADASGREVLSREYKGEATPVTLDITALPSGVYFVTLRTEKYTATRKLVVD